jgi:hypothetical protein
MSSLCLLYRPISIFGSGLQMTANLEINVVFTTADATRQAMNTAARLAADLGARIRLIVPQVVPYPISLDNPPVPSKVSEEKFGRIAADAGVETEVDIRYCRDRWLMLKETLKPGAIVVMGDNRLARRLRSNRNHILLCKKPASTALRSISLWFLYDFLMRWYIS